jgi:hypothetical protein
MPASTYLGAAVWAPPAVDAQISAAPGDDVLFVREARVEFFR